MVNSQCESNYATISGTIASVPTFSHEVYGEGFYSLYVDVKRLSNSFDRIPVMVSDRLAGIDEYVIGEYITVEGQFRSYNSVGENGSKLMLIVFAREIEFGRDSAIDFSEDTSDKDINQFTEERPEAQDKNTVVLNGYICKPPIYRTTPFNREIADILLAVNRSYNKSDYIPCISWGRNARYCGKRKVGENVKVTGRIQSRTYQKKFEDGTVIEKVAYEVSVTRLELLNAEAKEPVKSPDVQ
ncbi:MAG: single-stranded DNA-binding protein [Clostridia bacterium]|nr:single-stranded DNA-binding protein [Clostridia bacterium]